MNNIGIMINAGKDTNFLEKFQQAKELGMQSCQISNYDPALYTDEKAAEIRDALEKTDFKISAPQESREELQGCTTIPRVPQMSQSIPGKPVFPALPRLSSQGSTHTTVASGKALWESLEGKPQIP